MRIFKPLILGVFVIIIIVPCRAQVIVQGTVTDSLQQAIPNINIYATGPKSTVKVLLITFIRT